jgi:hypothetical protein
MYLLIAREREEISQKSQQIWIHQAKTIFSMQKFLKNYDALLKILQNLNLSNQCCETLAEAA